MYRDSEARSGPVPTRADQGMSFEPEGDADVSADVAGHIRAGDLGEKSYPLIKCTSLESYQLVFGRNISSTSGLEPIFSNENCMRHRNDVINR